MDSYGVFQLHEYLISLPGIIFFGLWFGFTMMFWYNIDKSKGFKLVGFLISTTFIASVATIFGVWPITTW